MIFWENAQRRATAVSIQLKHVEKKGMSNVVKSVYYRAATILICTVIEGLVYQLVKKSTKTKGFIISKIDELKALHQIPRAVFNREDIFICKKVQKSIGIDDNGVTFERLNNFLLKNKIINRNEFRKLDYVRKERNRLHLQSLSTKDTGYTKSRFLKVTEAVDFLTEKLRV